MITTTLVILGFAAAIEVAAAPSFVPVSDAAVSAGADSGAGPQEAAVALAVEALQEKLSVEQKAIQTVHVSRIDWPNSALGCPKAGAQYAQVVIPGWIVLLRHGKQPYRVHVGSGRAIVCDRPSGVLERPERPLGQMPIEMLQEKARQDLAVRLDVSPTEIEVVDVRSAVWSAASWDCKVYHAPVEPEKVKGFRLVLDNRGREFVYHSDGRRVAPCPPIEAE